MERRTFLYSFAFSSAGLLVHGLNLHGMKRDKDGILIKMIYNNTGSCEGMENAWGLAAWVETGDDITLFDTGGDADILKKNLLHAGCDVKRADQVIISHDHWDHKGGLSYVVQTVPSGTRVYVTKNTAEDYASSYPEVNIKGVSDPVQISRSIWSTGALKTDYRGNDLQEHSLLITHNDSMIILTGCSHPGIVPIVKRAVEIHPEKKISLVTGGFHLMRVRKEDIRDISDQLKELNVAHIAPSHCTGDNSIDIFREEWGDRFIDMNIGDTYRM